MTNHENLYDNTIWDPIDPEQAIEDPFHGPEAVAGLLSIPPMKKDDGTYHVFGAYYVCGTNSFDAEGLPFIEFKPYGGSMKTMRESLEQTKWIQSYHNGELPKVEEMGLPKFQLDKIPYIVVYKDLDDK
jgi:hypothetical protein